MHDDAVHAYGCRRAPYRGPDHAEGVPLPTPRVLRQSCLHTALRASKQLVPLDTYLVRICAALAALSSDILLITRSTLTPLRFNYRGRVVLRLTS